MYNVSHPLCSGGFGKIYAGFRIRDGYPVALKRIRKSRIPLWEDKDKKRPLEITMMQLLSSLPNVIQLLDWLEDDKYFLLILERPEPCKDLYKYILEDGIIPEDEAKELFSEAVRIFKEIFGRGIIHHDIKLENILITRDDSGKSTLKIIDFGAANFASEESCKRCNGTRNYCPPEWFRSQEFHGQPASVWSLGVVLYEMTNGKSLFQNKDDILRGKICFDESLELSPSLKGFILSLLKQDPSERPSLDQMLSHPWMDF
ncbi:UNVERIFIED_CONTAM: hypothetical protein GTU68_026885 [Idotea baltica]|nr:hypothetical protein [Idotea baltica]